MLIKKIIGVFSLFLCQVFLPTFAQQRNYSQVLEIANSYFRTSTGINSRASSSNLNVIPSSQVLKVLTRAGGATGESFYIVESSGGFVIISGDKRMKPILGYSDQKPSDFRRLPENTCAWLNIYAGEYAYLQKNPSVNPSSTKSSSGGGLSASVAPLLTVAWAQGAPYNDLCPLVNGRRAVTGCVATAMAQVMKYHEYPAQGIGKISYIKDVSGVNIEVNLDLEKEPLAWDKISSGNSSEKNHAIAWLMACCGAAIETTYSFDLSSASTKTAAKALVKNFEYDEGISTYLRSNFKYADFLTIIKKELSARRPIIADAFETKAAGHCFVFDGYDKNNLIHVNWGWAGDMNGYYELSSLNPGSSGPGSSIGGFNVELSIMIGIQKPINNQTYVSHFSGVDQLSLKGASSIARTGTFTISPGMCINLTSSFSGSIQLCLFQNGAFVTTLGVPEKISNMSYGGGFYKDFENVSIPMTVKEGDYQLHLATKDDREKEWQLVDMHLNRTPYYNVKIAFTRVDFTNPVNKNGLKFISLTQEHNLYQNLSTHFFLTIQNDHTEWFGRVGMQLKSVSRPDDAPVLIAQDRAVFGTGQRTFELLNKVLESLPVGDYYLQPIFSDGGVFWENLEMPEQRKVTVYPRPGDNFKLQMEAAKIKKMSLTEKDTLTCAVTLKNTGSDPFDGEMFIKVTKSPSFEVKYSKTVFLDPGQSKIIELNSDQTLPDGDYNIDIFYYWAWIGNRQLNEKSYECSIRSLTGNKK